MLSSPPLWGYSSPLPSTWHLHSVLQSFYYLMFTRTRRGRALGADNHFTGEEADIKVEQLAQNYKKPFFLTIISTTWVCMYKVKHEDFRVRREQVQVSFFEDSLNLKGVEGHLVWTLHFTLGMVWWCVWCCVWWGVCVYRWVLPGGGCSNHMLLRYAQPNLRSAGFPHQLLSWWNRNGKLRPKFRFFIQYA